MRLFDQVKGILFRSGTRAVRCERQATRLIAQGNELEDANNLKQAMRCYDAAIVLAPKLARAHLSRGNILLTHGDPGGALAAYEIAVACDHSYAPAHYNTGNAFLRLGQREAAIGAYNRAIDLYPEFVEALVARGAVLEDLGRLDESVASYREALTIQPDFAQVHSNLGSVLAALGEFDSAMRSYRRAMELNPHYPGVHNNLGNLLKILGQLDSAEACFRKALKLNPVYVDAFTNLGNVQRELGRIDDAVTSHTRALDLDPEFAPAHSNLGNAFAAFGQFEQAETSYRRALELQPEFVQAHGNLLFALNYSPEHSAEDTFAAYKHFDELFARPHHVSWRPHSNYRDTSRRLKIGYVAPVFWRHSCRHFLEPLLAHHEHSRFEVYAYAELAHEDAMTERYRGYVDHWLPTQGMTDDLLAERIRTDEIDILVDLAGHTAGNRLLLFARKPAPVSLHWLDFGYTTGLTAIDYYLTDWPTVPVGGESLFSETPWRLDGPGVVYRPAEDMGDVGPLPAKSRGHITFGTLTRAVRINHRTIQVWSEILRQVPDSRLIVNSGDYRTSQMQDALAARFAAFGINRERLMIGYHSPASDVLRQIDIGLDCFPHNSGTTLFESLYMGVPFVTLAGRPSVGRLGCSILQGLGHPEWVAQTQDEYILIAVAIAGNHPQLAATRAGLRAQMERGPLMDEAGFTRRVEAAYRQMFAKWASC